MNKSKILADHKKIGKRFIPPLLQMPGGMKFVKWLDRILPEIIWIGMLQEKFGIKRSVEICCAIAEAGKVIAKGKKSFTLAFISNYKKLTINEFESLSKVLETKNFLAEISQAIKPLLILYPNCPLNRLVTNSTVDYQYSEALNDFKTTLEKFFYRRAHLTNILEGTALLMSILAGHIRYMNSANPPDLNALVTSSPDTELYERTASSMRATLTLYSMNNIDEEWSQYFWNRGLEIDKCQK